MPLKLIALALLCNLTYWLAIRSFPLVEITSPWFIAAILLFILHNYVAFDHFSNIYLEFYKVLCYLTLFCWLIPIVLLLSCSANDNVLPTTTSSHTRSSSGGNAAASGGLIDNYFNSSSNCSRRAGRKIGLLSFFRMVNQNYLPTIHSSGGKASSVLNESHSNRSSGSFMFTSPSSSNSTNTFDVGGYNNNYASTTQPTNRKYY